MTINAIIEYLIHQWRFSGKFHHKILKQKSIISNSAFFTFVTLNDKGKPIKSIDVKPKTDEEKII